MSLSDSANSTYERALTGFQYTEEDSVGVWVEYAEITQVILLCSLC